MKKHLNRCIVILVVFLFLVTFTTPVYALAQTNTILVTNPDDSGPGSFRMALMTAVPGTTIRFDPAVFPLNDPKTIYLLTELPAIERDNIVIDASDAGVILDGSRLDVTTRVNFDNFEFRINDEVVFSSTFDADIQYWNQEDPESWAAEMVWDPTGSDDTGGSLAITIQPDGNNFVYFYEELPGVDWRQLYSPDGPQWYSVQPGDRVSFSYDYLGFDQVAFFVGMSEEDQVVSDMRGLDNYATDSWRHVNLATTIPQNTVQIFPTFRIENNHHGAGLMIASNGNTVNGLVFRNFYKGLVITGDDNQVGLTSQTDITQGCSGACNRIENVRTGVEVTGSRNTIAGNWIGSGAAGEGSSAFIGVSLFGAAGEQTDDLVEGNWIYPEKSGITIGGLSGTVIRSNFIGPLLSSGGDSFETGIDIADNTTNVSIGPDNIIYNADFSAIIMYSETIQDLDIFENEILGSGECGILIGLAKRINIHDNWFGTRPDGTIYPNSVGICLDSTEGVTIGPGNTIANNSLMGMNLGDSPDTQITENSIYRNQIAPIDLWGPVGDEPDLPEITAVSTATLTVAGRTSAGAIVEIYYNEKGEGGEYVLNCKANHLGKFYCTIPKDRFRTDVDVSALARFPEGGTSKFSEPYHVPPVDYSSLTGITGPLSVSTDPQVIGMSVVIAGLLLFSFNSLAEISTRLLDTLSANKKENDQAGKRLRRKWTLVNIKGKRWLFFLGWLLVLFLIAFAQSLLEDHPLFSWQQIQLTLMLLAVLAILSLVEVGAEWLARKRWKTDCQFCSEINFRGLIFVVGSVLLSRLLGFSPGVVIGLAGVVFLLPDLTNERKGPAALWALLAVFALSMVAWGVSVLFMGRVPILETFLLTLFFLGSQSVFFNLIPFGDSTGRDLFTWKKLAWLGFSLVSLAVFVYMVFMPAFTDVDAMRTNDYLTIYIIGGVLVVLSGLLWAANKWHWLERKTPANPEAGAK